tara:strand:- start:135 stop:1358 length:1224 start_codon:yes stop_codon:yes gene_type:complete
MNSKNIVIPNRKGYALNAYLELPTNQKPSDYAIFAHCFTCHSNLNAVRNISQALANQGYGVVRFDFTGLGRSKGEFVDSNFSANIADLEDVHQYMTDNFKAPSLLVGHSLGGAAVLVAANQIEAVKAVVTIGAPAEADHVKYLFSTLVDPASGEEAFDVNIGGRPFRINQQFIDELDKVELSTVIKQLRKPILILHSPSDKVVGIENAQKIYQLAHHPKSYVSLDHADHLLSEKEDSVYAGNMIGMWAKRYISKEVNEKLDTQGEQLIGHLDLEENNFTTFLHTDKHQFVADEPESVGGDEFGPTPYEYLLGGLAACTVMTLKLYAERKGWDLKDAFVYLSHSKKHIQDMNEEVGGELVYMDHIQKKLKLVGDLNDAQIQKLKEIASKCPVHRTLLNNVIIDTEIVN